ncbi:MAG: MraY family glycosyltransferase [Myxococcota bacterium]
MSCVCAFLLSCFLVHWIKKFALQWGLFDQPSHRKVHQIPVPRLGGVGIALSFLAVASWSLPCAAGGGAAFILGVLDDIKSVSYRTKLFWQAVIGLMMACMLPPILMLDLGFFGLWSVGIVGPLLIAFWFMLCMNAVNLIDGVDGLCAGVVLVSLGLLFAVTLDMRIAILMASVVGFLVYNYSPASIFMGDGGSYFLGFMLAFFCLQRFGNAGRFELVPAVWIVWLPIFELVLSIVRRYLSGRPIFSADRGHIHHHLLHLGLGPSQVMWLMMTVQLGPGTIGVLLLWIYRKCYRGTTVRSVIFHTPPERTSL